MNVTVVAALVENTLLLLLLGTLAAQGVSYFDLKPRQNSVAIGLLTGAIGILIMARHLVFIPDIGFDASSILISLAAFQLGLVPASIALGLMSIFRILLGGNDVAAGIAGIATAAGIGLLGRWILTKRPVRRQWLFAYGLGVVVHLAVLACFFFFAPAPRTLETLKQVAVPVLVLYPVITVGLNALLVHQKKKRREKGETKELRSRYAALFDSGHSIMLLIDQKTGRILDANPGAVHFYGWTREQFLEMNISQINTLSSEEIIREMQRSVSLEKSFFSFQHRRADGSVRDVEVYSGPIQLEKKTILYSIVIDVTDRNATEKARAESESRFRFLVENAPEGIFIQTGGIFRYVNATACRIFGAQSPDDLVGTLVLDRFDPERHEIIRERIRRLTVDKEQVPDNESVFVRLDGTRFDVEVRAVPFAFQGEDGVMVYFRDITERKRLEREHMESEARLRQQQKLEAIGTFASGVAHEINNPVFGIMNYAQLVLERTDPASTEASYLQGIIEEGGRVSEIVRSLLMFSRQEKQAHSEARIEDIVERTVSLIRSILVKDGIDLRVELDQDLPAFKCRSQQIQQVLMNLLTNARDALNDRYPEHDADKVVLVRCSLIFKEERRWLHLTVEDHGAGIPEQVRAKIFEPFYSTKPKEKGTGLGLSISFGIVQDHHGNLDVESEPGQFTRFHLWLPVDNGWGLHEAKEKDVIT